MSSMDEVRANIAYSFEIARAAQKHAKTLTWAEMAREDAFYRPATRPRAGKGVFVLGVCGAARSGKNTVAEHLVRMYGPRHCGGGMDVRAYALADSLKIEVFDWLSVFGGYLVYTKYFDALDPHDLPVPERIADASDSDKIAWINLNKARLRKILQVHGTELRRVLDESYWIDRLFERIAEDSPQVALVTDVRFANELAICHVAMKVEKIGQVEDPTVASHVSEREWREHDFGPYVVRAAEGNLAALHSGVEEVFERIVREFRVQ